MPKRFLKRKKLKGGLLICVCARVCEGGKWVQGFGMKNEKMHRTDF